ncbi:hypothetical protein Adt_29155 [Abeliophyllum distichum]|uniref:Uncharacterized protein n=1 Tax=Abeliophyllum distichum TaxID=126358 RepID=A0ABD1R7J1_9LAMI
MGTTTKWGRAKLNSSTIGQTVTMRQQPAPKMYHEYRLQISPAANTVSKSHQPAVQNTGFRVDPNHLSQNTGRGSSQNTGRGSLRLAKEKGAVRSRRKKKESDAGMHSRLAVGCLRRTVGRRLILEKTTAVGRN